MDLRPLRLVTIVAEHVLRDRLIDDLRALGARGYTITEVSGEGSRGVRAAEWEGRSVKIEVVASDAVAERILGRLAGEYFPHYAVIAWVENVGVVRGDKYV